MTTIHTGDAPTYQGGEEPMRGDVVRTVEENKFLHKENEELWVVTTIVGDMVRAKCLDAPMWRQAFYTARMILLHRKEPKKRKR